MDLHPDIKRAAANVPAAKATSKPRSCRGGIDHRETLQSRIMAAVLARQVHGAFVMTELHHA